MPVNSSAPTFLPAPIAAGASLTGTLNLGCMTLHGVIVPTNWTAADLTFQASNDGGTTWYEVYSNANQEVDYPVTPGSWVVIDPELWRGPNCLRVRSGTKAVPVAQVTYVALQLVLQPVF